MSRSVGPTALAMETPRPGAWVSTPSTIERNLAFKGLVNPLVLGTLKPKLTVVICTPFTASNASNSPGAGDSLRSLMLSFSMATGEAMIDSSTLEAVTTTSLV